MSNLATVNQVTALRLDNVEQLLVTYPVIISSGFTGTTPDGYGHVHLEFTQEPPPCTEGYLPPDRWRPGDDVSDGKPYLEARCAAGAAVRDAWFEVCAGASWRRGAGGAVRPGDGYGERRPGPADREVRGQRRLR